MDPKRTLLNQMTNVNVTVHGRTYSVGCPEGYEAQLKSLGVELDKRVHEIANNVGDIGETKLLLVAALMLLDEKSSSPNPSSTSNDVEVDALKALRQAAQKVMRIAGRVEAGGP